MEDTFPIFYPSYSRVFDYWFSDTFDQSDWDIIIELDLMLLQYLLYH